MDDIYQKNPAGDDQSAPEGTTPTGETRVMQPVENSAPAAGRRRRADRNRASYEEADAIAAAAARNGGNLPPEILAQIEQGLPVTLPAGPADAAESVAEESAPAEAPAEIPAETMQVPAQPAAPQNAEGTTTVPRFQTRYTPPVPGHVPSQGIPRPAALDQQVRRPSYAQGNSEPRRPVSAEGYVTARPLGSGRTGMQDQPVRNVQMPPRSNAQEQARRRNVQGYPGMPTLDDGAEYEVEGGKSRLLPILVILLLLIAALVLGLLLIPEDMEGPLGDVKRSVTGLFQRGEEEKAPVQATGFTGEVNKDTAPYQITFQVPTTTTVTAVRIVNERGEELAASSTVIPTSTDSAVHMVTLTLPNAYEGYLYLQISDGEEWLETEWRQQLTLGADMKLRISESSSTTLTAGSTAAVATSEPVVTEPTVGPTTQVTDLPLWGEMGLVGMTQETEQPEATTAPVITEAPAQEPTPTLAVTPTPTLALTPTPTVPVIVTPTAEPTAEPTQEPTPEPTQEPTPTPVPTPTPTVMLEAEAAGNASPTLISTQKIYKGTRRVDTYQRGEDDLVNMPAGDKYLTVPFGVATFRGNAFRMNAASGTVENPTSMTVAWKTEGGKLEIKSGWRYGFGVYSQPAIIKWTVEARSMMPLNEGYREKSALKEVIIAGQDGKIYFLDLEDGQPTRPAIDIGYALRGAPSVHSLGYPILTVGQYSNKLPNKTSKTMGLYYYNLASNERVRLIDTLDDRAYYSVGAMDTSALFDRNSNTLIALGTNGILYTEKLDTQLIMGASGSVFNFNEVKETASLISYTKNQKSSQAAVESSLAMYGGYAFYADMGGVLRCVDVNTMTTVWAVETGDAVRAAVALDLDEESGTLWLYTANTLTNRSKNGNVTIRRFNAMTGEMDWELPVHSIRKYTGQKDATGKEITAGAVASPVIGQNGLSELVYFTLSSVSAEGSAALSGKEEKQPSMLVALNKADGSVAWTLSMDAYSYSSPVAVYSEQGEGWIIQCCSNGTIYLLNGLTGETVSTLQVAGIIEGSPAVYGKTLVFGTTGKDKSFVYAIALQ